MEVETHGLRIVPNGPHNITLPYGRPAFLRVCVASGDEACRLPAWVEGDTHRLNLVCCIRHLLDHDS